MTEYFSVPELVANSYWKDKRLAFDGSNNLIYLGVTRTLNVGTSDLHWWIYKFTWSGSNLARIQGPIEGSWDNRADLGW